MRSPVGKTECWYFLSGTSTDASIYLGFRPGVTEARWRMAFAEQKGLLECLNRIPVKPGDFVFVDGGMPHAIGGGCFMVELQEPSDLMVVAERLTPSGMRIPEAKVHGGLGIDKMFEVYDYRNWTYDEICARYVKFGDASRALSGSRQILGTDLTDKFEMWRLAAGGAVALDGAPAVAIVTEGSGAINGRPVRKGDRLVVNDEPAVLCQGDCSVVLCR